MEGFCFFNGLSMFLPNHQSEYVVHGSAPLLMSSLLHEILVATARLRLES